MIMEMEMKCQIRNAREMMRLTCVTTFTKSFSARRFEGSVGESSSGDWSRPPSTDRYLQFDVVLVRRVDTDETPSWSWQPTSSGVSTKNRNMIKPTQPIIIAGTMNELAQFVST